MSSRVPREPAARSWCPECPRNARSGPGRRPGDGSGHSGGWGPTARLPPVGPRRWLPQVLTHQPPALPDDLFAAGRQVPRPSEQPQVPVRTCQRRNQPSRQPGLSWGNIVSCNLFASHSQEASPSKFGGGGGRGPLTWFPSASPALTGSLSWGWRLCLWVRGAGPRPEGSCVSPKAAGRRGRPCSQRASRGKLMSCWRACSPSEGGRGPWGSGRGQCAAAADGVGGVRSGGRGPLLSDSAPGLGA